MGEMKQQHDKRFSSACKLLELVDSRMRRIADLCEGSVAAGGTAERGPRERADEAASKGPAPLVVFFTGSGSSSAEAGKFTERVLWRADYHRRRDLLGFFSR